MRKGKGVRKGMCEVDWLKRRRRQRKEKVKAKKQR